jgi:cell division protein FtsB
MARNRKYYSAAVRFGPPLKAFLLCLLLGGTGVGYVWQKNQILQLGRQITKREAQLAETRDRNEKLRKSLESMRGPKFLEAQIKERNLGLIQPQPAQVRVLPEPVRGQAKQPPDHQFAAQ